MGYKIQIADRSEKNGMSKINFVPKICSRKLHMVISITIQSLSKVKDVENLVSLVEDLMNF